jgi:mRNA interferase MazF
VKKFDDRNFVKKETDAIGEKVYFKERDIFWTRVGENIEFEQNGKGEEF